MWNIAETMEQYWVFIKNVLRGLGQIFLLDNAISGFLFLAAISFGRPTLGIAALIGATAGTITAEVLGCNQQEIHNGLYGFNGALIGLALVFYSGMSLVAVLLIVTGSIGSAMLVYRMSKMDLPPFSAPFVLSTWILLALGRKLNMLGSYDLTPIAVDTSHIQILETVSRGFGQVIFQTGVLSGLLIFLGIFTASKLSASYALWGSILGSIAAMFFSLPVNSINLGLFGYNGVVCSIAFGQYGKYNFFWATSAILLSVLIFQAMVVAGINPLTGPFVLSAWAILIMQKLVRKYICLNQQL